MADNDDYMVAKAYDDTITELMWDRLQEGINANRRFRLRGIAGGNNMRYSSTKVVWDSDVYIYFTRESDGAWVYNKISTNPTTGITCDNDDILYVTLNDTTATVLTVSSADYTSMPTDDTGRILVLGSVRDSRWYGISTTDISHDSILGVSINDHHAQNHNNTYHTTNYEAANANIQSHVGSPPADSHHTKYALTDDLSSQEITQLQTIGESTTINSTQWGYVGSLSESPQTHMSASNPHSGSASDSDLSSHENDTSTHGVAQVANHAEIASQISTHAALTGAHHTESHTHDSHTGTLSANEGGTGQSVYVVGDILYAATTTTLAKLEAGDDTDVLTLVSGLPSWEDQGAPGAHAASHGPGGADEISLFGGANFDTDTGSAPFYISRLGGTTETCKMYMEDINFYINFEQDEAQDHIVYWNSIGAQADYWAYAFQIGGDTHLFIDHNLVTVYKTLALGGNSLTGTGYSLSTAELGWLEDIYDTGVTSAEFDRLDGVTSPIQTQFTGKMSNAASGDRILCAQIPLGAFGQGVHGVTITASSWAHAGNLWTFGKDANWHTNLNLPAVSGWTIKYTFQCHATYSSNKTLYIRLYNRVANSVVTGSEVTIWCGQTGAGYGLYMPGESGYITTGGSDLDISNIDGYQFDAYINLGGSIWVWGTWLNIYLVKN